MSKILSLGLGSLSAFGAYQGLSALRLYDSLGYFLKNIGIDALQGNAVIAATASTSALFGAAVAGYVYGLARQR